MGIRASLASSYHALPQPAARMFRLLGLFAGPDFGVEVAAATGDMSPVAADELLTMLTDASLLETAQDSRRYRLHDLVRLYAAELLGATEFSAAADRLLDWYLDAAERVLSMGRPRGVPYHRPDRYQPIFCDWNQAVEWFEVERAGLVATLHQAVERGRHASTWMLADAVWYFFRLRKYWADWQETHLAGLAAAHAVGTDAELVPRIRLDQHATAYGEGQPKVCGFTHPEPTWPKLGPTAVSFDDGRASRPSLSNRVTIECHNVTIGLSTKRTRQ